LKSGFFAMSPTTAAEVSPSSAVPAAKNYLVTQLDAVPPVPCPCGQSRRGFATPDNKLATIHLVDISIDAQTHYHKQMTEIYLILEGEGFMELDGERIPARPMMSIFIKPGCRHRLVGKFKIVNVAIPAFDPRDEWLD
jgi:mannose-6-phosphate isomerase-like protein (cupin superfamily)